MSSTKPQDTPHEPQDAACGAAAFVTNHYTALMVPPDWWPVPGLWVYPRPEATEPHSLPFEVLPFEQWRGMGSSVAQVAVTSGRGDLCMLPLSSFADLSWWRHGPAPAATT